MKKINELLLDSLKNKHVTARNSFLTYPLFSGIVHNIEIESDFQGDYLTFTLNTGTELEKRSFYLSDYVTFDIC